MEETGFISYSCAVKLVQLILRLLLLGLTKLTFTFVSSSYQYRNYSASLLQS